MGQKSQMGHMNLKGWDVLKYSQSGVYMTDMTYLTDMTTNCKS
jgi:hypothetical protein